MASNEWGRIWGMRSADTAEIVQDSRAVFMELKRADGFDLASDGITYDAWHDLYENNKKLLSQNAHGGDIKSVYEVGCGSGANLYLYEQDGITAGGLDYSVSLIDSARKILRSTDLTAGEANQLRAEPMYDAVFSESVFRYFTNIAYVREVLERMYQKCRYSMGVTMLMDEAHEEEFYTYRRSIQPDFDERYKNLPNLFLDRSLFKEFAQSHDMEIVFDDYKLAGYWNAPYEFSCFMYKKEC